MAFPWIFHSNFESADGSEWDSETDTESQLDFPTYRELARFPWGGAAPRAGAAVARWTLSGGTADAILIEADIDIALSANRFVRFDVWFSPDFAATADDTFPLLELLAVATQEVVCGAKITATTDEVVLGIGEVAPTAFGAPIKKGVWYTVELDISLSSGGADGTVDIYVTEVGHPASTTIYAAQVGSLTQAAVTTGSLGTQDVLATTTGVILIDNFVLDDTRVYPDSRYSNAPVLTKSSHVFVGPGFISSAALLTDEANNKMVLWDTDRADTNGMENFKIELDIDGNHTSWDGPLEFKRGCYAVLSGTDPRGQVFLARNHLEPGVFGPKRYDDASVRRHGLAVSP